MREWLTRENLGGVWAALTTPFDESDRFDEAVFRENVRRLAAAGVHGVYTTDSDGEFYAIDFEEYQGIVDVLADEAQRLGLPTQVGVTWIDTRGTLRRLRYAAEKGILGAHVGHPLYMEMTPESLRQFWADVSAAVPPRFALIHYNSPRMPNSLSAPDYARLAKDVPNLIGSKQVGFSLPEFLSLIQATPQLAHFTVDNVLTPFVMFGARGNYSWLANFNAPYAVAWWEDCLAGRWAEARHRQERFHRLQQLKQEVFGAQNRHAIGNKAVAAASGYLTGHHRTRRPYLPISEDAISVFRRRVSEELPDLLP
jgi:4-hydroxy-tetrahydrodipicolinate synthase